MSDQKGLSPAPETVDETERCNPVTSLSLSSPYSQRSQKALHSSSSSNPRWTKEFKLVHHSEHHGSRPDVFVSRSRSRTARLPLAAINSTAGRGECLGQTQKQWETIIRQAKIDDKVSDVMKAAKFFRFGHVIRDLKPAQPSEAYVFIRQRSETEAREEMDGCPLPLEAYATGRRQDIRDRRRRSAHITMGSDDSEHQPTASSTSEAPHQMPVNGPASFHRARDESIAQASSSCPVERFKSGHDLGYLKFNAEEHLNDSELVKGIGRVPINQKIPDPINQVEDRPWELTCDAWALTDFRFLLQKMITSDLTVNNLAIMQPPASLPTFDDPEALQLKWNGKIERKISVFKGHEVKSVAFKDVIAIKYNRKETKLLILFSPVNSDRPEKLLLILLPVTDVVWQSLQTCCYSLVNGKPWRQRCDVEGQDFFDNETKALMNLRLKLPPMPVFPNRAVPQVANRGANTRHRPRRPSRPIFQTRLNPSHILQASVATPTKASSTVEELSSKLVLNSETQIYGDPQSAPDSVAAPEKREASSNDEDALSLNNSSAGVESEIRSEDTVEATENSNNEIQDNTNLDAEREAGDAAKTDLYYKSNSKSRVIVPVRLNDLVVRLRGEKERERDGKRDKLDLFDGPWRIVELPEAAQGMKISIEKDDEDGNSSPSLSQYNKVEIKKMLKTKVKLGFPRESNAVHWVELSCLLPITKLEDVRNGKLHASCWGVAELSAFITLQKEMEGRNLETFDHKNQTFIKERSSEKPGDANEGAENDVDEDAGEDADEVSEEDADEDEVELPMHIIEVKNSIFVAIMEADPKAVDDGDCYLVEKLRGKRLRLFKLNSTDVRKHKLKTDKQDPWVKLLLKEVPELAVNRIVVSEYKVHWAGWPDEDDTWCIGSGNIAKGFIDEYHTLSDPLRGVSTDTRVINPRDMVFKDDLPKQGRGRPQGKSRHSKGSVAANSEPCNLEDQDEDMLDEDVALAKVVQASLDDAKAEKTEAHLKALQKEMGVGDKQSGISSAPDAKVTAEDDGFMEIDGQDGDLEDDDMTGGDNIEISDSFLVTGSDEGDEA